MNIDYYICIKLLMLKTIAGFNVVVLYVTIPLRKKLINEKTTVVDS